ncbi:MAG: PD-(D/E)XK nuclease family protein [Candidatus Eremiobacterota bacterium]
MISSDFQFSQANLQDYTDCPRRFQLTYLLKLPWPSVEAEPVTEHERNLYLGTAFHRMVCQHIMGVPEEDLQKMIDDRDLKLWWHNYLQYRPYDISGVLYPETVLSCHAGGLSVIGKYDLIAVSGDRAIIIDWKTSRKKPSRNFLQNRIQTRLYLYLLIEGGKYFRNGKHFDPEKIEMRYWFPSFPESPEMFGYNSSEYQKDKEFLTHLIEEINSVKEFRLTEEAKHCLYCSYRSLCERGIKAGAIDKMDDEIEIKETDINLDFDQIGEIEF